MGIAFDDDGTGCASLTMLQAFPVKRLKIARSFASGIDRRSKDQAIVEAIARLARGFASTSSPRASRRRSGPG